MANDNQNSKISLSRRKILAGVGVTGAAGIGAGLGTSALFSDEEQFANNQLVAGELDLKVSWEEHYFRDQDEAMEYAHMEDGDLVIDDHEGFMDATLQDRFPDKPTKKELDKGTVDPCEVLADIPDDRARPLIELDDVKPGDFGEVTFDFALCDNPGFVWMNGELLENAENGLTEPESDAPNEDGSVGPTGGELADAIQVTIWYDEDCDNRIDEDEDVAFEGSLREALEALNFNKGLGLAGDADRPSDIFDCFESETRYCIGFKWELPADRGNEVQSDSVKFDLGFYTEQCRNNEGPEIPPVQELPCVGTEHVGGEGNGEVEGQVCKYSVFRKVGNCPPGRRPIYLQCVEKDGTQRCPIQKGWVVVKGTEDQDEPCRVAISATREGCQEWEEGQVPVVEYEEDWPDPCKASVEIEAIGGGDCGPGATKIRVTVQSSAGIESVELDGVSVGGLDCQNSVTITPEKPCFPLGIPVTVTVELCQDCGTVEMEVPIQESD